MTNVTRATPRLAALLARNCACTPEHAQRAIHAHRVRAATWHADWEGTIARFRKLVRFATKGRHK